MHRPASSNPAPTLAGNPWIRGFLAALFTAGVATMVLTIFSLVAGPRLPGVFITVLITGVFAAQMQERMRRSAR